MGTHEKSYKTFNNTLWFPTNTSVAQLHTFQSRSRLPPGQYMQVYSNTPGNTVAAPVKKPCGGKTGSLLKGGDSAMHQKACIVVCAVDAKCSFG